MKHIIILGDGMADEPIASLGGLTPLQYARTPYMDKLATLGVTGRMKTVADGFHPGSEVANMAVLGYDVVLWRRPASALIWGPRIWRCVVIWFVWKVIC